MQVLSTTVSFTVEDVSTSADFFTAHLGYREQMAADGFVSLTRDDAPDLTLLRRGIEVLPEEQRERTASGVTLVFTVAELEREHDRLRDEGITASLPIQEEEWGERLFQITDPNGVIVEFVEWKDEAGPESWS